MQGIASAIASNSVSAPNQPADNSNSSGSLASSTDQLTNETTFLKVLTAQIQHQDPLNPADPTQFIGQLVQFSELEQLLGINQGVKNLVNNQPSTTATAAQNTAPANTASA